MKTNKYAVCSKVVKHIHYELTSWACPEQYDVFYHGKQIAYIRERHGLCTVESPDCGDKLIYRCECDHITPEIWDDIFNLLEEYKNEIQKSKRVA